VTGYLEAMRASGPQVLPLTGDRIVVGKGTDVQLDLTSDAAVSRLHAVVERVGSGWCIRDLGSRNGTFVNGERILGERALRTGDEIRVGQTRLLYRARGSSPDIPSTAAAQPAPDLTRRERHVLIALCRPVLGGDLLTEPASVRAIAAELVLTESAVKKHLANLFDKFELYDDSERRRGRLASDAIRRGAISLSDLRSEP